jgi:outer membrane receptor for ferrienterochelin and colicins
MGERGSGQTGPFAYFRLMRSAFVRVQLAALAALAVTAGAAPLTAQQRDSGVVIITVQEPMGPVAGATVRSEGRSLLTDGAGRTRLVLPAGRRTLEVARIGYVPKRVAVVVVADSTITVTIDVAMEGEDGAHEMEAITVTATRTERLADDTPLRVEVLDEMEVDENTLMAPSGITMLLNETPGLRVFAASPSLGTGSVRVLGLPGQYTAMLADGLPLYGGASSAMGPLDISPVDLLRVEVIKGAASALYGGQALGGVINLVSKPATGRSEVLLNRRTLGVTDAAAFLSRRLSEQAGLSLLVSGTRQQAEDLDDDGWADQARARRWGVRPRYTMTDAAGRSLFVTAGYGYDRRDGGTLGAATAPDGFPFREGLTSRRADAGATLRLPRDSGYVALRLAVAVNRRMRVFGAGPAESDRITTGFAEVSRAVMRVRTALAAGAALQFDGYTNALNPGFGSDWLTPGLFVTGDRVVGPVTVSLSLRGDWHPAAGFQLTERLALLARPASDWSVRLSAGTGFAPPAPLNEETEATGLRRVLPPAALRAERSLGLMADVSGRLLGMELLITTYGSYVSRAVQLAPLGDSSNGGTLRNAAGTSRIAGAEGAAIWRFAGGRLLLSYGYARGSRTDAVTGGREMMPMIHRHRAGGDLMLEKPGVYRMGVEGIWYGAQALDDNPYRTRSRPYLYAMAIASRQFGPVELVANFENLLDVRQTRYDPLVLPAPMTGGRWTTDVWAPLEGFMANVALRYRWPSLR